ncbi:MAG: EAL domain-containing protein [Micavibrio sp.]|nr:MAG: EAL domain-containing protein [Micavibrio sp.]
MPHQNTGAIKTVKKGDFLMQEGQKGDCAYIIETGRVEIMIRKNGAPEIIGTRGAGALLGEMAMIDDQPRTASVRALEDCTVLVISREDFIRRAENADPILRMVTKVILARYRDMLSRTESIAAPDSKKTDYSKQENDRDLHAIAVNTIKTFNELKSGLENGELLLHFQPIVDLDGYSIAGFEALARWQHPEKGMISPGVFIPVAEESGLIVDISRWALEESCKAAEIFKNITGAETAPFISVNFSVQDFLEAGFFSHVTRIIEKHKTPPENIHLEITESLLMEKPHIAKEALQQCQDYGIEISIDDFGTGYSSLSYLHAFPISTLKIDQSFIRSMLAQESSFQLVKSIIALAKNLDMRVIAEGIEHAEEAAALKNLDCEYCQGYWFAKPQPLEDAAALLQSWTPPEIQTGQKAGER